MEKRKGLKEAGRRHVESISEGGCAMLKVKNVLGAVGFTQNSSDWFVVVGIGAAGSVTKKWFEVWC